MGETPLELPAAARPDHRPPQAGPRLGDDPNAAAVPVGVQGPRDTGARVPRLGEARQRRRAAGAEADRRWLVRNAAGARASGRVARRVWIAAAVDDALYRIARADLLARHAARGAE